jgi:RyR domain
MTSRDERERLLAPETIEVLARAMHENYVREQQAKGDGLGFNPSLVPWGEADESIKTSNRRFAEGIAEKLEATGCALRPTHAGGSPQSFRFTDREVEELARIEHERWVADLLRDGWHPGPVKDPAKKEHPLLVPWSELSKDDRDKDRDAVRNLPSMLLHAGFEIERVR